MCGFAGFLSGAWPADAAPLRLKVMTDAIAHRGPDSEGQWLDADAAIALGHRRLSIVELSAAGAQPMQAASGRYVLAFNGEVYNHMDLRAELEQAGRAPAWRGHSDTETLLAGFDAWGIRATVERAVGMFAFAVWCRHTRTLTLAHLLTMSAGWQVRSTDMPPATATDALRRRMAFAPGKVFQYDNASSHLVAIAVARATGMSLEAFADEHLLRPLGIDRYIWGKDKNGNTLGWSGLQLRLLDLLKIGELVLLHGLWHGRRIVSESWINEMLTARNEGGPPVGIPYAYQWYVQRTPDLRHHSAMAIGSGGQFLYLVPDLRLVVAITHTREQRSADFGFMRTLVLPAIHP